MKSPWRFVANLISRRRPLDPPGPTIEHKSKLIEIDLQPAARLALPAPEALSATRDDKSSSHGFIETTGPRTSEITVTVSAEAGQQEANAFDEPDQAAGGRFSRSGVEPAGPAKKGRVNGTARGVAAGVKPTPSASSRSEDPFLEEMASLDEDIKNLKANLIQKLRSQNAQLREMLKRFERSGRD